MHKDRSSLRRGSFFAVFRSLYVILIAKPQSNGNVHKTDRHIAEIAAAGVRIDDNKGGKGNKHHYITGQQKYPVFKSCPFFQKNYNQEKGSCNTENNGEHKGNLTQD